MMNGTLESSAPKLRRAISPRPQTVGEEVKVFHDTSNRCPELYKNCTWNMEDKQEAACESEQQYRPTTPAEYTILHANDSVENSSNPSPPPPYKWAQSLICLLEDIQGVNLFQQFLEQEGQDTRSLKFWFACRGVKRADPNDREGMRKLIKLIFEKKVNRISAISATTKEEIKQKLCSNVGVDDTIFDTAQKEVEIYMMQTTYPNFLRSDIYIQHLGGWKNDSSSEKDTAVTFEPNDLLPTVHEDSELQISSSNKALLTRDNLWQRNRNSSNSKGKPEIPAQLYLKSPYGNYSCYHSKYSSFLPASAQDSELQSLSSDAQTDDTMSLTDGSIDYSMKSKREQKRQLKAAKLNARENKEIHKDIHSTFIPRTLLPQNSTHRDLTSKESCKELLRKLEKIYADQKVKEKFYEKFNIFESNNDYSKQEQNSVPNQGTCHKTSVPPALDFFFNPSDDNVQDILDQHVSRVFSGQHTPACSSPGCISPPIARPPNELNDRCHVPVHGYYEPPTQDLTHGALQKMNQNSQFTVPHVSRHRKDHDTQSKDSGAMYEDYSDDSLSASHRIPSSVGSTVPTDYSQSRRYREQMKRTINKKLSSMTDSSSSCVDSGISMAFKPVPPSSSKVTHWLETNRCSSDLDKEQSCKNSSTSPILSRSSSSRKAVAYNSSRLGTLESGSTPWPMVPSQEMCMSAYAAPESTLFEASRRLSEENNRNKMKFRCASNSRNYHDASKTKFSKPCELPEEGFSLRKQSRKSCPATMMDGSGVNNCWNDVATTIGYSYGRHSVPYMCKVPGKNITLRKFKSLLSKRGNFRYFFKKASNDFGTGVVFEEITDDYEVLPLWEGKIFCVIEPMEDN